MNPMLALVLAFVVVAVAVILFLLRSQREQTGFSAPAKPRASLLIVPDQFDSIQQAVAAARHGDTVIVRPGVYVENIDFSGKRIRIASEDPGDRKVVAKTVIDGHKTDSCVVFVHEETPEAVLEGLTLTNGAGRLVFERNILGNAARAGGGVYIGGEASPVLRNNIIRDNRADLGGGIYITSNSLCFIEDNLVTGNRATLGGGVRVAWDFRRHRSRPSSSRETFFGRHAASIEDCTVLENEANIGGGVSIDRSAAPVLLRNNIAFNSARWDGGGVAVWDSSKPRLQENQICDNRAGSEYGYGAGISIINNCKPLIERNRLENNKATGTIESGGGAIAVNRSDPIIRGNAFVRNQARRGPAVFVWGNSNAVIENNELEPTRIEINEYRLEVR